MAISQEREDEMYSYWCEETNEAESEEWRYDLTDEESKLVEDWDYHYVKGMSNLFKSIIDMSEKLEKKEG